MAIIALGTFPEGILGGEVFEVSVGTTLPGMVFGRRALYDELIWDSDGGFAANWAGYSSLTGDGTSGYTFLLQRNGYSAAGFALFSSTAAGSGGGSGNVTGPGSSTDNAITRWNGNTGTFVQNSLVTIDDAGNISLPPGATVDGVDISALPISTTAIHVYVATTGSDANPGTIASPKATMAGAYALLPTVLAGPFIVHFASGSYVATTIPQVEVIGDAYVALVGDGAGQGADNGFVVTTTGTVDVGSTTTVVNTTGLTADVHIGQTILFTSGALTGNRRSILRNSTTTVEMTAATVNASNVSTAATAGDTFQIVSPAVIFTTLATNGSLNGTVPMHLIGVKLQTAGNLQHRGGACALLYGVEISAPCVLRPIHGYAFFGSDVVATSSPYAANQLDSLRTELGLSATPRNVWEGWAVGSDTAAAQVLHPVSAEINGFFAARGGIVLAAAGSLLVFQSFSALSYSASGPENHLRVTGPAYLRGSLVLASTSTATLSTTTIDSGAAGAISVTGPAKLSLGGAVTITTTAGAVSATRDSSISGTGSLNITCSGAALSCESGSLVSQISVTATQGATSNVFRGSRLSVTNLNLTSTAGQALVVGAGAEVSVNGALTLSASVTGNSTCTVAGALTVLTGTTIQNTATGANTDGLRVTGEVSVSANPTITSAGSSGYGVNCRGGGEFRYVAAPTNVTGPTAAFTVSAEAGGDFAASTLAASSPGRVGVRMQPSYVTLATSQALTNERVMTAGAGLASTDGGAGGAFTIQRNIPQVNLGAVSAYTLLATDDGKLLQSAAVVTVTIPDNASVALPAGAELWLFQTSGSASQITIVAGAGGVVLRVPVGYTAATRTGFSQVRLRQISANLWAVDGDLKPSIPYLTVGAVSGLESERAFTAGAGLAATDGGADGAFTLAQNIGLSTVSATSYTFVLTDAFKQVAFTNAAGLTATIPPNSSVAFPVGTRIWVQQNMAAAAPSVTIAAGAGVSMSVPTGRAAATRTSQSVICLHKIGTDAWVLSGELMDTSPYVTIGSVADMYAERALTGGAGLALTDGGAGGAATLRRFRDFVVDGTTARTLGPTDAEKVILFTSSSPVTVTVGGGSPLPARSSAVLVQAGTGQITVVPSGVTLRSAGAAKTRKQYSTLEVWSGDGSTYYVSGDEEGVNTSSFVTLAADANLTNERVLTQGAGLSITDGGAGGAVTVSATGDYTSITTWTATTLTLSATHRGGLILAFGSAAQTLTLPTDGADNLPIGYRVRVLGDNATSAFEVTLSVAGLTYKGYAGGLAPSSANVKISNGQWADIVKVGANSWVAMGYVVP